MERHQPLRRKTALRAKRHEAPTGLGPADFRIHAFVRSRGLCECGCRIALSGKLDDHHVFPKSRVSRRVRDEFWNRVLILQACHIAIHDHGDIARKRRTEQSAVKRLLDTLGRAELAELVASIPEGATEPKASVAAYERMRAA